MINGKSVLAIVPARGGSKGIPKKNLATLSGISLVGRAGMIARQTPEIDQAVVSTDDSEIGQEARRSGLSYFFSRPASLSGDLVGDVAVLSHALTESERYFERDFDIVVMLQPTSPLRTAQQVSESIRLLIQRQADSVWTVTHVPLSYHPEKQMRVSPEGHLDFWLPSGKEIIARQQLSSSYVRNGVSYVIRKHLLTEHESLLGKNAVAMIIEGPQVSIDTPEDLAFAEDLFERTNCTK